VSKLHQKGEIDVNKTVVKWLNLILIIKNFDSNVWSSPLLKILILMFVPAPFFYI
jgi:hypothetical protein